MDELEISGKRYISTRRAGKENKYHADYIGQLIRAKKVAGQKVGRSWYVEADSLAEYLGKETERSITAPRARVVVEVPVASEAEETVEEDKKESTLIYRTTREAREAREARGGLRYVADESPLLPQMQRQASSSFIPVRKVVEAPIPTKIFERVEEQYTERGGYEEKSFRVPASPRILYSGAPASPRVRNSFPPFGGADVASFKVTKGPSMLVRAAAVLLIGLAVFVIAAFASTHLLFTVTVDGGQSTDVRYGLK